MAKKKKTEAEPGDVRGEMNLQAMIEGNQNKYLMINLIAARSYELKRGSRSTVDLTGPHSPLDLALAEGVAGTLKVVFKKEEKKLVNLIESE